MLYTRLFIAEDACKLLHYIKHRCKYTRVLFMNKRTICSIVLSTRRRSDLLSLTPACANTVVAPGAQSAVVIMDPATPTAAVKCPVDRCEYRPNVTDAALAATLLTVHAQSQHVDTPAPAPRPMWRKLAARLSMRGSVFRATLA